MTMTHEEEKALEIIRLIFHGGLSRDKQEAVKQVAAIIQRGVEPGLEAYKSGAEILAKDAQ